MLDLIMEKTVADNLSKTALALTKDKTVRVLHVDDDENCLTITKQHLEKVGHFQVDSVLSVRDAYKFLGQKEYDVIISDYVMPERNGLEFLKQLRNNANNIPFVLFTGTSRKEVLVDALNLGAYRYFNKNEKPDTLYLELAHSLNLATLITNSKKAEIKLKESETKFGAITAAARDGIILIDNLGKIAYWNPASEKIFGYNEEEAIGKNLHMLLAPEQSQGKILESFASFQKTGKGDIVGKTLELMGTNKHGKKVPIEISLSSLKLNEQWYALALVRDSSERKTAWISLERTIDELVKINEKLTVVGRLTRHDARNKLAVILNNIFLAKKRIAEDEVATGYLQSVNLAVEQMKQIFEFARTYERVGIEELSYSKVEKCFCEAVHMLSVSKSLQITNQTAGLVLLADSLLRQVFYNLVHNSLVHAKDVNKIRVYYKKEKNQLHLMYEDNGPGIAEDKKDKIFCEGYGKGTGYGLYLIQKICENYGWTIKEMGVPGEGAKFVSSIPKHNKKGKQMYCFDLN